MEPLTVGQMVRVVHVKGKTVTWQNAVQSGVYRFRSSGGARAFATYAGRSPVQALDDDSLRIAGVATPVSREDRTP